MLKVRVRYKNISNEFQITTDNFICNKMVCRGFYNRVNHEWYVVNLVKDKIVARGKSKSEDESKKMIKKSLKSFGAKFLDGIKATKNNQTPKLTEKVIDEIVKQKEGK